MKKKKDNFSIGMIVIIAIGILGFIFFSDNEFGNMLREKVNIDSPFVKRQEDTYVKYIKNYEKNDEFYIASTKDNDEYISTSSIDTEIKDMLDSGMNITTPTPTKIVNDTSVVYVDSNGNLQSINKPNNQNQSNTNDNNTNSINPTIAPTQIPTPTTKPQTVTPIVSTQVVTPIISNNTQTNETPIVTQQPIVTQAPIITQTPIITPEIIPTQAPIEEQPTYTINQDAYNNASNVANQYQNLVNDFLTEINNERKSKGLNELTLDNNISQVAGYRAYDMATNKYFSHDYNGVMQINVAAYAFNRQDILHLENLGRAKNTTEDRVVTLTMDGWKNSAGHYKVMIMENLNSIGIAISQDNDGTWYICTIYCK